MKNKSGLKRTGSKIVFGLISLVILLWTASLTTSFLKSVLPGQFWAVPYLGLVVFDGGMIGWMIVYLHNAEGSGCLLYTSINRPAQPPTGQRQDIKRADGRHDV